MLSKVDEIVEAFALGVPAAVLALLTRRWWRRRARRAQELPQLAANDDPPRSPLPRGAAGNVTDAAAAVDEAEPAWPDSYHMAETCRRLNRNMAETANLLRRPRPVVVDIGDRLRTAEFVRILRGTDDRAAWALLEPITVSGEVITLIETVRQQSGEFSAQSLRLCIERLWGQRVARDAGERSGHDAGRRGDPAAGAPPPA